MTILVTGSAGFIGSELCIKLLERGDSVIGIDNHNDYYDPKLKEARLARHLDHPNYSHLRLDISDKKAVEKAFQDYRPKRIVNLAAQAGVRYSMENPHAYIESNIVGFMNILESCRHHKIEHLVYASSSSVYGANTSMPFSVHDNVDHPLSLYAASKKSNELMAHTYSHLYGLPTTGLRFFTVYGPWGRPDMALFKFTKAILNGEKIQLFNNGKHRRDFTYIDDVVGGIIEVINKSPCRDDDLNEKKISPAVSYCPWRVFNIGNGRPVSLNRFIELIEEKLQRKAEFALLPLQPGDVEETFADIKDFENTFGNRAHLNVEDGIQKFLDWYVDFYQV